MSFATPPGSDAYRSGATSPVLSTRAPVDQMRCVPVLRNSSAGVVSFWSMMPLEAIGAVAAG